MEHRLPKAIQKQQVCEQVCERVITLTRVISTLDAVPHLFFINLGDVYTGHSESRSQEVNILGSTFRVDLLSDDLLLKYRL